VNVNVVQFQFASAQCGTSYK